MEGLHWETAFELYPTLRPTIGPNIEAEKVITMTIDDRSKD